MNSVNRRMPYSLSTFPIRAGRRIRTFGLPAAAIFSALATACTPKAADTTISQAWERPATRTTNGSGAADADPGNGGKTRGNTETVAQINDRAIPREWLAGELIAAHGLNLLLQRLWLDLVREAAAKEGVVANAREIESEYDLTLRLGGADGGGEASAERRRQMIDKWRASRGVSEQELRMAMERQATLRKLASRRMTINEQMVREEFARLYGTKVECRQIVLASLRDAERVRPYLEAGEDFATIARRHSVDPATGPDGGQMRPFTQQDDTIPAIIREAAFRMSPGETSNPIAVKNQYHIIKLEKRLTEEMIKFDAVRGSVEESVKARQLPVEMEKLFTSLQQSAKLRIQDPALRKQYNEQRTAGRIVGPEAEK